MPWRRLLHRLDLKLHTFYLAPDSSQGAMPSIIPLMYMTAFMHQDASKNAGVFIMGGADPQMMRVRATEFCV